MSQDQGGGMQELVLCFPSCFESDHLLFWAIFTRKILKLKVNARICKGKNSIIKDTTWIGTKARTKYCEKYHL